MSHSILAATFDCKVKIVSTTPSDEFVIMNDFAWYAVISTQIIAESLPISSSGHVALIKMMCGISLSESASLLSTSSMWLQQQLIKKSVDHFLHGPTLLIVLLFFYDRWFAILKNWRRTLPIITQLIVYVGIADFITGLFFIASRCISIHSDFTVYGFMCTALLLTSLVWCTKKGASLTISKMVFLGLAQGCALLFPGVSRFAITYVMGRWLSLCPRKAFEISWLIQMPLIGVSFLHALCVFRYVGIPAQLLNTGTALVMMGATIGAWYALCFASWMSLNKKMWWFVWYMGVPITLWVLFS